MSNKMTRIPSVFRDEGKLRAENVRWALESFNYGIKEYIDDLFMKFHNNLNNNIVHLKGVCCLKCSQKKPEEKWCSLCKEWSDAILAEHQFCNTVKGYSFWRNIDSTKWASDVEEVQKVFLPTWCNGKLDKTDLSTCLNIMTNCKLFINRQELLDIRDIRNKMAHGINSLAETERQEYIAKILSYLNKNDLQTFASAREALKHVRVLKKFSIKEIHEMDLIDEQERNRIEKRIYEGKRSREERRICGLHRNIACILLVVLIAVLTGTFYPWNKNDLFEDVPWTPGQPSFFFTSHKEFVGREWLKQKIRKSLNQSIGGVILVAEPGFGKSALVANMIKTYGENESLPLLGYHICQHDLRSSQDVSDFIINFKTHLQKKYTSIVDAMPSHKAKRFCSVDPLQCFQELIVHPLKSSNISERSLFILDALDECQHPSSGTTQMSISELLFKQYRFLIPIVSIFMTSRNDTSSLSLFRRLKQIHIKPHDEQNKNDLRQFIQRKTQCTASKVNLLVKDSSNNFLMLEYYLSDIKDKSRCVYEEKVKTLAEIYDLRFFRLYGNGFSRKHRVDRSFFEVLSSQRIKETITIGMMKNILKYSYSPPDDDEFEEMIQRIKVNLISISENDEIRVPHSSLFDWLISKDNIKFKLNTHRGHYFWVRYLYDRLQMDLTQEALSFDHPSVDKLFSLTVHFIHSQNESLQNDLNSGKFKLTDIRINCTACWEHVNNNTLSLVEYAATIIDDYQIFRTLTLLSLKTDWSKEAQVAMSGNNMNAFNALMETGMVDLKKKHETLDIWTTFGRSYLPGMNDDMEKEEIIGSENLTRKQLIQKAVGNFSLEYGNLFHFMIFKGDIGNINTLLQQDKTLMDEKSGSGWDVFDIAILSNNNNVFSELTHHKKIGKSSWHLWYASLLGSTYILDFLFDNEIKDECAFCRQNKFDGTMEINDDYLKNSKFANKSVSPSQALRFRWFFICESALMVAVKRGNYEIVKTLLSYGSSCLEQKDAFGFTPLAAAIYFRHDSIVKLLIDNGANINFVVKGVINSSDVEIFNSFLRFPLENRWNFKHSLNGATIYHLLSLKPTCVSTQILRRLLKSNPTSLEIKDSNGNSPLYYAICHPDADNDYARLADYLHPKSHRMVFVLIEASYSRTISDTLLTQLGICGTRKQQHSEMLVKSRYGQKFCNLNNNFPETKDFIFTSENRLLKKYLNNFNMILPHVTFVASEKLMSSDWAYFFYRQFPQAYFNSKERIKFTKELSDHYGDLYMMAFKSLIVGPSVFFY